MGAPTTASMKALLKGAPKKQKKKLALLVVVVVGNAVLKAHSLAATQRQHKALPFPLVKDDASARQGHEHIRTQGVLLLLRQHYGLHQLPRRGHCALFPEPVGRKTRGGSVVAVKCARVFRRRGGAAQKVSPHAQAEGCRGELL